MNSNIKITNPITQQDYEAALRLIEENLYKWDMTIEKIQSSAQGELLLAKDNDKVVGMLNMRYPGKIFEEIDDEFFALDKIELEKKDIGYIALVSIRKDFQGKGVGRQLVKKTIKQQKEWGSKAIIVHASKSSPGNASEKLFFSFGFEPIKLHKQPWHEYSQEKGPKGFWCQFCGNPCTCDELEMVKYL